MSEQTEKKEQTTSGGAVKTNGLYTWKVGMTQFIDESGEMKPCTVLKYDEMTVSQVKTDDKDGYTALQCVSQPKSKSRSKNVEAKHFKGAGVLGGYIVRELQTDAKEVVAGAKVDINSLAKGDTVKATGVSKGKGFAGAVKRWNSGGGPAAHGSCFHRQPGSSGNRTWPGRIMKGKHFPGHLGDETTTVKNLTVLDVIAEDGLILVSGAVPGGRNGVVRLIKQ